MGLGDFIRGSLATKQLCIEYNIPFEIDFRCHPIGSYLQNKCSVPVQKTDAIHILQDIPNYTLRALQNTLKKGINLRSLRQNNLSIYTNVWPVFKIHGKVTKAVKDCMQPTEECEHAIGMALNSLSNYEVIHIRVGDLLSFGTQIGNTVNFTLEQIVDKLSVIQTIQESTTRQCIIMSDSAECKRILAERYGLTCTSTVPRHMAIDDDILDTLIDYFILSRSAHIHQFSVHHWGSGFSDSVNWLYGVPVTKHRLTV
jgi:hypothetical protein